MVVASKQRFEALINDDVCGIFAYPYGDYGERETEAVKAVGCQFRIAMFPHTDGFKLWKKSSGWYLQYCRLKGKGF